MIQLLSNKTTALPMSKENRYIKKHTLFVTFPWVESSTGPGGFMICVFII